MSPVAAGTGISLGTVALVGGVIAVAGIAYFIYKNNETKSTPSRKPLKKLLDDEDKYNTYKTPFVVQRYMAFHQESLISARCLFAERFASQLRCNLYFH